LSLGFVADSIPSALTILNSDHRLICGSGREWNT
jgi:hypothetical protein